MPLARSTADDHLGVDAGRGRWCRRPRSAWPARPRTAWRRPTPRPSRRGSPPTAATARRPSVEPALGQHPLQLLVEQEQRGQGRRVVGLVEAAVVEGDRQVERGRHPPPRGLDRLDALDGGGREQRHPEPAVGGEELLGGEVVDVDLGRVPRQRAGGRGGVDEHEARRIDRPLERHHHAGRRLVVGEGVGVDVGLALRPGMGARGRVDDRRVAAGAAPAGPRRRTWRRTRRTRGAGSRCSMSPKVATSQNAVEPPLPSTISQP